MNKTTHAFRSDQTLDDVDLKPESIRKKLTSLRSDKAPGADGRPISWSVL